MENENLFSEFPPVSVKEWKEKIIKDLKGADYDKKLVWHTSEGFDVQPFYVKDDLSKLKYLKTYPASFPYLRGNNISENRWKINEYIEVSDIEKAADTAKTALERGAQTITFALKNNIVPSVDNLKQLFSKINNHNTAIHLKTVFPEKAVEEWKKTNQSPYGSVLYDPVGFFSRQGKFFNTEKDDLDTVYKLIQNTKEFNGFKVLTVDASLFDNSGADISTSMAYALSTGVYYLDFLTKKGISPGTIFNKILFKFAVSSNYFMEIAKFRAIRFLWAKIAESYGVTGKEAMMTVHAENSVWNKTLYDPYVNMLRTTTETMSAIIGGADEITTLPFDTVFDIRPQMAKRIARNQQLILRDESYLNKVVDIAAGSYYIENLTDKLINKAWQLFLNTEDEGGYLQAFKNGNVQKRIKEEARKKDIEIATRKRNILGVNQFPNINEHLEIDLPKDFFKTEIPANYDVEPLLPYRGAAAFEAIRYKTDRFSKNNKRPTVWMFTYGNLAMRRARAQFAGNFFGCAGYEIVDNNGFSSIEEGINAALKAVPNIVVLCSSDDEYEKIAVPVFEALKDKTIVVLAGYPKPLAEKLKKQGFEHFIHTRSNVLDELQKFQNLLINEN